ncbi:class I SAM-dependent methyltransferase, partial [Streptomyces sp. A7024]
ALFDALEDLTGRPLTTTAALDCGAGTGIATRLLTDRGARVTALEPGLGMAARLHTNLPHLPLVQGDGNTLPFADASFDLVTYAQAFHWTDPGRSVPEAMRVLRPGGALALWWNQQDSGEPWIQEQEKRLSLRQREMITKEGAQELLAGYGLEPVLRNLSWSRRVTIDDHLRNIGSHSHFIVMGDEAARVLAAERDALLERFPDGELTEHYVCALILARRPADPAAEPR